MRRIAARLILALAAAAVLAAGCDSDSGSDSDERPPPPRPISQRGLVSDLTALDRIARSNGGERAAGTPGYAASVSFVEGVLRRAGWRVRVQPVPAALWRERSPARLSVAGRALRPGRDFRVPSYAAAGSVSGTLQAVDDGCQDEDFDCPDARAGRLHRLRHLLSVAQDGGGAAGGGERRGRADVHVRPRRGQRDAGGARTWACRWC